MTKQKLRDLSLETIEIQQNGKYVNNLGVLQYIIPKEEEQYAFTQTLFPTDPLPLEPKSGDFLLQVTPESTIAALMRLQHVPDGELGALNFASGKHPGGGFLWGTMAQEESLAYSSNLYSSLVCCFDDFYNLHRRQEKLGVPPLYSSRIITSNKITLFRDENFSLLDTPFQIKVVSSALPKRVEIEVKFRDHVAAIPVKIKDRMDFMFRVAQSMGIKYFVLGAWGCGVFKNDPLFVARTFKEMLAKYGAYFNHIVFAVYGDRDNFNIFHSILRPGEPFPAPQGNCWHTNDFPWKYLGEGYRPLLENEVCEAGDLVFAGGMWLDGVDVGAKMTNKHLPTKTTRPLP